MERDYHLDNYKAFLILMVVIGHFLHPIQANVEWANYLRKAIFLFHMPAFIFISGYFGKRNDGIKLFKKLLIPYLIMQLGIWLLRLITPLRDNYFTIVQPYFTLWFLPCLFFWRLAVDKLSKVKGIVPISFAVGILAGFDLMVAETLSLSRMLCFFPYFLLGYRFDKKQFMDVWRNKWIKLGAFAVVITIFAVLALISPRIAMYDFLFRRFYIAGKELAGAGVRIALYLCGIFLTYLFLLLIPEKKCWFSWIGTRTMSIYLFHGLLIRILAEAGFLKCLKGNVGGIVAILLSVGMTALLATKPFHWLTEKMASVPVERLFRL